MNDGSQVVIYIGGDGQGQTNTPRIGDFVGKTATPARRLDPHKTHHDFPDKWRAYLHAAFRNHFDVAQTFQVSERAARRWWNGEGGVNGGYVAVAIETHPIEAPRRLFAAE